MKYKNLINILDGDNQKQNFMAAWSLTPENIIFLYENNKENKSEFIKAKEYLNENFSSYNIIGLEMKDTSLLALKENINGFDSKDTIVNLSCGSRVVSLLLYKTCEICGFSSIYVDTEKENILDMTEGKCNKLDITIKDMEVKDFIEGTGGEIISHSTNLFQSPRIKEFIKFVTGNYEDWNKFKRALGKAVSNEEEDIANQRVKLNFESNDSNDKSKFKFLLEKFKELRLLNYNYENENEVSLAFDDIDIKSIFLKTGTWLEILVYSVVKEIKEVDDIKGGVVFLWDNEQIHVKNEIDVLASVDSKLVYISCKDTSRYGIDALNELDVYGKQIGGEEVIKILVATKEPFKRSGLLRAKEMGIDIVIFDGNVEELKKKLIKLILEE